MKNPGAKITVGGKKPVLFCLHLIMVAGHFKALIGQSIYISFNTCIISEVNYYNLTVSQQVASL